MVQQRSQARAASEVRRATDAEVGVFLDNLVADRLGKPGDSPSLALWAVALSCPFPLTLM